MKAKALLYAAVVAVVSLSCTREVEDAELLNTGIDLEFTAEWADEKGADSRTVLQEDGTSIWWSANEEINVFIGKDVSAKFVSTNTQPQGVVSFVGNVLIGAAEQNDTFPGYWAVYPYNAENSCDGQSLTLSLPYIQKGKANGFADKFFPSVARSNNFLLSFRNVCGGARFSITREGIKRIVFKSKDGSPMAGKVKVGFGEDNKPQILEVVEPVDSVVVNAPEGGFIPGENYFAAMLPQTHSEGMDITLKQKGKKAEKVLQNSIEIKRSTFGTLNNVDDGLEYVKDESEPEINPDDIIEFADSRIKTHCVAAFDTNGDGELSYAEAAAVTDVSTAFTSTLYTSFDEFRYFTGVTEIPANWFKDRARLKSIALPVSITSVGSGAFSGCAAIEKVSLGGNLFSKTTMQTVFPNSYTTVTELEIISSGEEYSICASAFNGCTGLASITLPEGLSSVGANAFKGCNNLTIVNIPSIESWLQITFAQASCSPFYTSGEGHLYVNGEEVTEISLPSGLPQIGAYAFYGCSGIQVVSINDELTEIGNDAFAKCTTLKRVNIPDVVSWLRVSLGNAASSPFYDSREGHLYVDKNEIIRVTIPEGQERIGQYIFCNCANIAESIFPATLKTVEAGAFDGCRSLTKVNIPSLAAWMDIQFTGSGSAPFNASKEGHLFIKGVELKEPVIPEETTDIKSYAFYYCTGFGKMIFEPTVPPTLGTDALTGIRYFIVVWDECIGTYKSKWTNYSYWIVSENNPFPVPEAIDLGLPSGIKWASFNLGASNPEEYGEYYAWGETNPKAYASWDTYKWCKGNNDTMTKYCTYSSQGNYGYDGFMDNKTVLDLEDDAATCALGDSWRIPTKIECDELRNNCTWTWITRNNINGRLVTGPNGNSIFLPAAGRRDYQSASPGSYGEYWSSTLGADNPVDAWSLIFGSGRVTLGYNGGRYYGLSVRPVLGEWVHVTGVILDTNEMSLMKGRAASLKPTVAPANAAEVGVTWESSNPSVASVSPDGTVIGVSIGSALITARTVDGGFTAVCKVTVEKYKDMVKTPEIVDLGLSVKWASFNLGASKPEEYGEYFAWGETEPKREYTYLNYKFRISGDSYGNVKYSKYSTNNSYGLIDNKIVLDPEDDAAAVALGGSWRIPSKAEQDELRSNCTWEWTALNGVSGYKVTSNMDGCTDKWIFLPAAGNRYGTDLLNVGSKGYYWSSALGTDDPRSAYFVWFSSDFVHWSYCTREDGLSVRPVCD